MDFCGRFIVASALTEPVIVGHIRASIRVPQCLELAQRRPMMYPRTPAQLTPFPPGLWGGWAGVGPRLYDTSVLRLQLINVCDLCFTEAEASPLQAVQTATRPGFAKSDQNHLK